MVVRDYSGVVKKIWALIYIPSLSPDPISNRDLSHVIQQMSDIGIVEFEVEFGNKEGTRTW